MPKNIILHIKFIKKNYKLKNSMNNKEASNLMIKIHQLTQRIACL